MRVIVLVVVCLVLHLEALGSEQLLIHSPSPLEAESSRQALLPWETPVEAFFVRSHHAVPNLDETTWKLKIDGLVERPVTLTFAELKSHFARRNLHAVLECSGNGRALQSPQVGGVQWRRGAVGNAEWSGVSLKEILQWVGVKDTAKFLRLQGADAPVMPTTPVFARSIPLSKAMSDSSLLAFEMNREPLPLFHGGPVRVVLPGWYGENWMKWVTHITVTKNEDDGFYMKKGYRMPKSSVKPGEAWDSSTGAPVEELRVQSFVLSPAENETVSENFKVTGKTFSGAGPIVKVEISLDGGVNFRAAQLSAPHKDGGWQEFEYVATAKIGDKLQIIARATDSKGNTQPNAHVWNPGGYLRNASDIVAVQVGDEPIAAAQDLLYERCLRCHASEFILGQKLTHKQWESAVKKMEGFGAQLSKAEGERLVDYLALLSQDMTSKPLAPTDLSVEAARLTQANVKLGEMDLKRGMQLYTENCSACHGKNGEGNIGPRLMGRLIPWARALNTVRDGKNSMPAFSRRLDSKSIESILSTLNISVRSQK